MTRVQTLHRERIDRRGRRLARLSLDLATLLLVGIALLLGMRSAQAGELSLLLNGTAMHMDAPQGMQLNERNWGMGLEYEMPKLSGGWIPLATAAQFRDSNNNDSTYIGAGLVRRYAAFGSNSKDPMRFDAGFVAFLMTRKGFNNDNPFPGVIPAFSLGGQRYAVNMTYIPKVDPTSVPLLFIQLKIALASF